MQMNRGHREEGTTTAQLMLGALVKTSEPGAEQMAQWFRALVALAEDRGSILSTHIIGHNHLNSSSGDPMPSSDQAHIHTCRQKPFRHTKLNKSGKNILQSQRLKRQLPSEQVRGPYFDSQHPYSTHTKSLA